MEVESFYSSENEESGYHYWRDPRPLELFPDLFIIKFEWRYWTKIVKQEEILATIIVTITTYIKEPKTARVHYIFTRESLTGATSHLDNKWEDTTSLSWGPEQTFGPFMTVGNHEPDDKLQIVGKIYNVDEAGEETLISELSFICETITKSATPNGIPPSACMIAFLFGSTLLSHLFPYLRIFRDTFLPSNIINLYYHTSYLLLNALN